MGKTVLCLATIEGDGAQPVRIIDVDGHLWVCVLDLYHAACMCAGHQLRTRPTPATVSIVAGKTEAELFKKYADFGVDAKATCRNTSYMSIVGVKAFLDLTGLPSGPSDELIGAIVTAEPSAPVMQDDTVGVPDVANDRIMRTISRLEEKNGKYFRLVGREMSRLNDMVVALAKRVEELEVSNSADDAADAILAEASRLYAKGKAMKGAR